MSLFVIENNIWASVLQDASWPSSQKPTSVCCAQDVAPSHIFTCAGVVQLPFAEPQLGAVHRAGVELQPEHRVPVGSVHPPVVALDLQGAAETRGRRGVCIIFSPGSLMRGSGQKMPGSLVPGR